MIKSLNINQNCPDIDIIGINSYAGAPSLPQRYHEAGGIKPYVLTEYGPPGVWEFGKNAWGVPTEPNSTEKAAISQSVYEKAVLHQPCVSGLMLLPGQQAGKPRQPVSGCCCRMAAV